MRVLTDWLITPERGRPYTCPPGRPSSPDLHLGYDDARRRRGEAVCPLCPLDETLGRLGGPSTGHGVRRLVVAGDLLEDWRCAGRHRGPATLAGHAGWSWWVSSQAITTGTRGRGGSAERGAPGALQTWRLITGVPVFPEGFRFGPWHVVHGDGPLPRGRVVHGHEHPASAGPAGLSPRVTWLAAAG